MRTSDGQKLKESKNFNELLFGAQCIDKEQTNQELGYIAESVENFLGSMVA